VTALTLFAATFAVVFLLGLQQLLVHGRRYLPAFVNSVAIGTAQLALYKLVPHETSGLDLAAYLAGGPLGIVAAMGFHDFLDRRRARRGLVPPYRKVG
jgi:hypothetical protein